MSRIEEILHSWGPGESRFALIGDGRVQEFVVDRPTQAYGHLFLGRIIQINKALGAAFVDIGRAVPGFLPLGKPRADQPALSQGMSVLVQAQTEERGAKGPKLSLDPFFPGRYWGYSPTRRGLSLAHRTPEPDRDALKAQGLRFLDAETEGATLRSGALHVDPDAVRADLERLRALWASVREATGNPRRLPAFDTLSRLMFEHPHVRRIVTDDATGFPALRSEWPDHIVQKSPEGAFEAFDAEEEFENALSARVALPSGGALTFQPTLALLAIDIDSGGASAQETNQEAVAEIARQIRLRNDSGQLVADFIPIGKRGNFTRTMEALRRLVKNDPIPTHVLGVTPLGLVEMMRERRRASLSELFLDAPEAPAVSASGIALRALRQLLRAANGRGITAAPDVIAALKAQTDALSEAERRLGGQPLVLQSDPSRRREDYSIE